MTSNELVMVDSYEESSSTILVGETITLLTNRDIHDIVNGIVLIV